MKKLYLSFHFDKNKRMDFDRVAWFTAGVLVGSSLDRTTTFILLLSWAIVSNKTLPEALGGISSQELIFRLLNTFMTFAILPINSIRTYRQKEILIEDGTLKTKSKEKEVKLIENTNLLPLPKIFLPQTPSVAIGAISGSISSSLMQQKVVD